MPLGEAFYSEYGMGLAMRMHTINAVWRGDGALNETRECGCGESVCE